MARPSACSPTRRSRTRCSPTTSSFPNPGELSGTLFIELNDDAKLREWLPKLIGIQRAVRFELADGSRVEAVPEDEERLTREDITATVHYLKFPFTPDAAGGAGGRSRAARRRRPSRVPGRGRARPTISAPSWRATSRSSACTSACNVSIPSSRFRPAARRRRGLRPPRTGAGRALRGWRPGAGADRASRWRSRRATPGSCSALGARAEPRRDVPEHAGADRSALPRELKVLLVNTDPSEAYTVQRGDRIAQLVVQKVELVEWLEVTSSTSPSATRSASGRRGSDRASAVPVRRAGLERAVGCRLAREGAARRGPRLLDAVHARPLRRHRARADGGVVVRRRGHDHAAGRDARARQRLQAPGRRRQGSGDPRRAVRRPARVRSRCRVDDGRLRRARVCRTTRTARASRGWRRRWRWSRVRGRPDRSTSRASTTGWRDTTVCPSRCSNRIRRSWSVVEGRRCLRLAGRQADIVGVNPTLRAGEIGVDAAQDSLASVTRQKIEWVREGAGDASTRSSSRSATT